MCAKCRDEFGELLHVRGLVSANLQCGECGPVMFVRPAPLLDAMLIALVAAAATASATFLLTIALGT
ncbi:hypothetical protein GobsT_71600 [Gemmata obscuriglobus]|uniref:Uncharacterized protein n=1 Tax=Gemmata obscuriglobus TaxID=114 RepID=A0A2Z3H6V8_9BACT|nr:hypothetical protein [Gemmata obscuriglobus]AWM41743.1 hypothetical protein C1280_35265 [Gemmata obscuriglobus]QEG32307.1 hypothetical protein GobsT_71600 [Gemmata obscuriglobus]VTS11663.1 unnamed protein product [Gemmata obscuriglobus UQM 2246]